MSLANATVVLASLAILAADDTKKEDADVIKGKWVAVSIKAGGGDAPEELVKSFKMEFDGKKYVNTGGGQTEEGGYTIDSSKSPKTIEFDIKAGSDAGKKQLGIYKIDDGKLTIAVALAGATERPKSFGSETDAQVVVVLEREKP